MGNKQTDKQTDFANQGDTISRQAAKRMTERNVGLRNATNDKKAWSE